MRIFTRFPEAFAEIKRDLAEMGTKVHPQTMQDKDVSGDTSFDTLELQNYNYTVLEPFFKDLNPTRPWVDAEWKERLEGIEGRSLNPGEAYKLREEIWSEFLHNGRFAYTYSERLQFQVMDIIERLKKDPESRQLYIGMWSNDFDTNRLGSMRVPCSLGWHFMVRRGKLHMTYFMRSCDLITHFHNDVYLSLKLQDYVAIQTGIPLGNFTHFISSLHVFQKDVVGVF